MSCGARPVGHRKFCRQCGVALNPEQVICIQCGSAINNTEEFQPFVKAMSSLTSFNGNEITIGEATIYAAAFLAFFSFFLPWVVIPDMMLLEEEITTSQNGFSSYGFLLGILFIYPVWIALTKKKTIFYKIAETACAVITLIFGTTLPFVLPIRLLDQNGLLGPFNPISELEKLNDFLREPEGLEILRDAVGTGAYLFICACIVLIVGIVLRRLSPRSFGLNVKSWNINMAASQNAVVLISEKAKALPKPVIIAGIAIIVIAVYAITFGRDTLNGTWVDGHGELKISGNSFTMREGRDVEKGTYSLSKDKTKLEFKLSNGKIVVGEYRRATNTIVINDHPLTRKRK
ncbi:MAG: hypothetical protein FWH27_00330 [Planctomycetaceae bacterium]|nr:hypothetical protein [Planctomycetaceae bacterium]